MATRYIYIYIALVLNRNHSFFAHHRSKTQDAVRTIAPVVDGERDLATFIAKEPDKTPCDSLSLSELPNVAKEVFLQETRLGPRMGTAAVGVQKAALNTFQTWKFRGPQICGILYGKMFGKKRTCTNLIVADSFEEIEAAPAVKVFMEKESVFPMGVVISGHAGDTEAAALAVKWCQFFATSMEGPTICAFAARTTSVIPLLGCVCRYLYIYSNQQALRICKQRISV